ncbi:kinesin-like protein KIN-1 [Cinnamomum micranthum f. kanehirae]|uniref:Kinesin-like protein n=1 Tax=Cinnamomum micranthum f. kanehirae TaxID=337451 RepID=A0A3S3QPN3_9MAGN|nr:kinesin-like protein KIN-1 [Cinnamomum micranthum f. kanehirae]
MTHAFNQSKKRLPALVAVRLLLFSISPLSSLFANLKKSRSDSKTLGRFHDHGQIEVPGCRILVKKEDMSNVTVCVRFRPLNSREKRDHGDNICIRGLDAESFVFKDEKDGDFTFSFDRVFYQNSAQEDVFDHLAMPIVRDAMNAINGTIITYGQTGAGKTYSMEGPSISECNGQKKGIVPRVVDALFGCMRCAHEGSKYTVKLSMVEIYMERVRDLFDLARDNLQIKESKAQGIFLSGATEICIVDSTQALQAIAGGIANRAVGETQMNMASSRSHCVYLFSVQQESTNDGRVKIGKLILVDLAGSEKVDRTGAEGRVLEEAKTINKSLSALGNVISALTNGKVNHIPYRDSKLTRILQDALGGNSRTALLCCCSPSSSNASESLSTLRFGARHVGHARAKHIRASSRVQSNEDKGDVKQVTEYRTNSELRDRLLNKLRVKLNEDDVKLLEELFIVEGIIFDPYSVESYEVAYDNLISQTISALQQTVEDLVITVDELKRENNALKAKVAAAENVHLCHMNATGNASYLSEVFDLFGYFSSWIRVHGPEVSEKRLQ